MNNPTDKLQSMGTQSKETVDLAAAKARDALNSAGKTADQAIDKVADKVDDARDSASTALEKAAGKVNNVANESKDRFGAASRQVRAELSAYSDRMADYAQNEPVKAMLIAAAAGAIVMSLVSLLMRSDD